MIRWWQGDRAHLNLAELASWLYEGGECSADIVRMLEKPWDYETEYQEMRRAEQATREDYGSVDR